MPIVATASRRLLLVAALSLGATVAHGLSAPAVALAQKSAADRFAEAQALFDAKSFAEALPIFQELVKETGSPNARLYVARSLRELGRTTEAYDEMSVTVRDSTAKAQTEAKYAATRDASASELALLESKVAHLVLATTEPTPPSGVVVNGASLDTSKLGSPVTILPGHQVIEISRAGHPVERREVDVPAGETKTVAIAGPSSAGGGNADKPPAAGASGGELRWVGIGVAVLGVGAFAAFAGTKVAADAKFDEVEQACGGVRCTDPAYADAIDEGKSLDAASTAMVVVGSLLVAGSIPMIIFGGPSEPGTAKVALSAGPGFAFVSGSF